MWAEAERFVGLGARVWDRFADHPVLADPEGNEFCVVGQDGWHPAKPSGAMLT
ncbi:hypothetical protein RKD20_001502 [Streptomyces sp. SLBN-8D4]|jgi:hypothetical protein